MNAAYQSVRFRICVRKEAFPNLFAIITAYNPRGDHVTSESNTIKDAQLSLRLRKMNRRSWRVTGGSPDFSHAEPGFAVELSLADALMIGRKFKQEAIFWVENDCLSVIACEGDERIVLGSWRERISKLDATQETTP